MKFIRDIHREKETADRPVVSFEFFPPKTDEGDRLLLEKTIPALMKLNPDYCSVTYGAGGSTRDKTLSITERIQKEHGLTSMAHLTCVCATRSEIQDVVADIRRRGIKNILALRGDPPGGVGEWKPTAGGFEYSYQLVQYLKEEQDFGIGVAGFPEGHIACREGREVDWDRLKAKIECGADFVITQMFFDNTDFLRFRDHMVKLGVKVPICPGIISILSVKQIKKFTTLCGASIPAALMARLDALGEDDAATADYGIEYATTQCQELLREGVPGLHFYTLNKTRATTSILRNLNLPD